MDDSKLLELASLAAGEKYTREHNPLERDDLALRLAVQLLFEIDMGRGCIAIRHSTGIKILEAFNHDPLTATRRAIVRAAAEIGRQHD